MNSARSSYTKYAALTSIALALMISSCSAPVSEDAKPSEIAASQTISPNPTAPTSETIPIPEIATPNLTAFTFPDGHISFNYPSDWTLKSEQGPYLDHENETDKANAVVVKVYDKGGSEVAMVTSGGYGGGVSGPEFLTVLDSETISTIPELLKGGNPTYAFIQYDNPHDHKTTYYMGLINDRYAVNGDGASPSPWLLLENGAASATVTFDSPAFKSPESAKAWMETQQYIQLKALMTSVSYK